MLGLLQLYVLGYHILPLLKKEIHLQLWNWSEQELY
nr:MAG TPA: hypothetical protein [Caudoviricetes sp.]